MRSGSSDRAIRAQGIADLLLHAKEDASTHPAALQFLRAALRTETDSIIAVEMARGLSVLAGPEESRTAWLALIHQSDPQVAASAIFALSDSSYAAELLGILEHRTEARIHVAALFRWEECAIFVRFRDRGAIGGTDAQMPGDGVAGRIG